MARKQIQESKDITLNSTMVERSNPVYLENVEDNRTAFAYLQNSDSFYSNALVSRQGTEDFCGGPVQYAEPSGSIFYNITNAMNSGFPPLVAMENDETPATSSPGTIIIADRNIVLSSGTFSTSSILFHNDPAFSALNAERNYDLITRVSVFQTDSKQFLPSGAGFFASYNSLNNGKIYNINKGVNFDANAPYVTLSPPSGTNPLPLPLVQTDNRIGFSSYTDNGIFLRSNTVDVPYVFESPVTLASGNVYFLKYEYMLTSGTTNGKFLVLDTVRISGSDPYPNMVAGIVLSTASNGQQNIVPTAFNSVSDKDFIKDTIYEYAKPAFMINDNPSANISLITPLSGNYFTSNTSLSNFNPLESDIPFDTTSVEFGTVTNIASGVEIQGAYFYATVWGTEWNGNAVNSGNTPFGVHSNIYTRKHELINPLNYTINLNCNLASIDTISGTITSPNYRIIQTTTVASGNTQYTFNSKDKSPYSNVGNPNFDLKKIHFLFDEPVTTTVSGNYLLSWNLKDINELPLTDYGFISFNGSGTVTSPIQIGYTQSGSGFVTQVPDSNYFYHPTLNVPSLGFSGNIGTINSGLISLAPSGTSINGIVDYTTSALVQWIAYHQGDKIKAFQLSNPSPSNHIVIHSGLQISPNALATYEVYDDMLLSTNYGFNQPQIWDSSYLNTSGSSTYDLGHGAVFSGTTASGVGNLVSGTYSLLFATELLSGGYKASTMSGVTVNGSGVGNNAIIHVFVSGGSIASQYPFDIPTTHGATRVFMNLPSGIAPDNNAAIFYLANLSVSGTLLGSYYPNPLPNNISDFYITNLSGTTALQVPDVILESQSYLQNQFMPDIPKYKRVLRWYDYIMAFGGDDGSLLYYSQIGSPQIYGGISAKYGFLTIGNNSGSPITSIARYKQWLLAFTKNTLWKITYQGSSSTPFLVEPISTRNGDIGVFSTVETDDAVFGINQYGIFAANAGGIECISKDIDPFFKSLNKEQLEFSTGLLNQDRREIYWSISNDVTNPDSTIGLTFNYEFNTISVRKAGLFNSAGIIRDEFGFDILLGGDFNGFINKISANTNTDVLFNDGIFETTEPIEFIYETEWMFLTGDTYNKFLDRFHQNVEPNTGNLILQVFFDGKTIPSYTRTMKMTGGNPDKIAILGGQAVSVKFRVINQSNISPIKINSMTIDYHPEPGYRPM